MEDNKSIGIDRVDPRYIMVTEDIYAALSPEELRVYMALRYEADYSKETSIVKRSIAFIVEKSKVGRRKVFYCLASLETQHFLIQRIQLPVTGVQNNYNVSRTLNFFNLSTTSAPHALDVNNCAHLEETSAYNALTSAYNALTSAPNALLIINSSVIIPEREPALSDNFSKTKVNCLSNQKCIDFFEEKFSDYELTIEELYDDCELKSSAKAISPKHFLSWIVNERLEGLKKKTKPNEDKFFRASDTKRTSQQDRLGKINANKLLSQLYDVKKQNKAPIDLIEHPEPIEKRRVVYKKIEPPKPFITIQLPEQLEEAQG